ncbi:hypothetical protein ACK09Q_001478 [Campylobacter upsaliensis]
MLAKRDGLGFSKFKGKTWLNAEHLGGCAFRFFASALPRNSSHEVRTLSLEKVLLAELCFAVKRTLKK